MKKLLFIILLASCTPSAKEINDNPILVKTDTIVIEPHKRWFYEVNQPFYGKVKVDIWNLSDTLQKYIIEIKEVK